MGVPKFPENGISWALYVGDVLLEGVSQWTPCPSGPQSPLRLLLNIIIGIIIGWSCLIYCAFFVHNHRPRIDCCSDSTDCGRWTLHSFGFLQSWTRHEPTSFDESTTFILIIWDIASVHNSQVDDLMRAVEYMSTEYITLNLFVMASVIANSLLSV